VSAWPLQYPRSHRYHKDLRKRRDVYIIGQKHSEKLLLMEAFLKSTRITAERIHTQNYPGPNWKSCRFPLINRHISTILPDSETTIHPRKSRKPVLKAIVPIKRARSDNSRCKTQSLFIGGLSRVEIGRRRKNGGGCYFSVMSISKKSSCQMPTSSF
jgi:hypothetical protein